MELLERKDMDPRYQWRLTDIYPSSEKFEADFEKAKKAVAAAQGFQGRVREDPLAAVRARFEASKIIGRLFGYAFMKKAEDSANTDSQTLFGRCMGLAVEAESAGAFLEPELLEMDAAEIRRLIDSGEAGEYDVYLSEILRRKPHTLSAAEEKLLSSAGEVLSTPGEVFGMFDNVDVPFPEVTDEEGESRPLTHASYGVLIRSGDERVREEAYRAMMDTFGKFASTVTAMYSGHVKGDIFTMRARKYSTCREMSLDANQIPEKVYDSLIAAVGAAIPSLTRALEIRRKRMGLERLRMWDLYAPILKDFDLDMDYDTAYDTVVSALGVLGRDYTELLEKARNEGWIDVYPNKNKRSGAYSSGCWGVHPYVLLNQTDNLESCFTIAHEMGHALHTWHSEKSQPYAKSDYSLFVAEVASTTNEVLLMRYLMDKYRDDPAATAYLNNQFIESFRTTVFRQTLFAEFEYRAHTLAERGVPLTKENLGDIHFELNKKYYGAAVEVDDCIRSEWMRIPHFYRSYYVYVYATGYCAAAAIADRILREGAPAVEGYKRFLSAGSSVPPIEALKYAGVDMNDEKTVAGSLRVFDEAVTALEKALAEMDKK